MSSCYKADNVITGQRVTAARKFDKTVVDALNDDALCTLYQLFRLNTHRHLGSNFRLIFFDELAVFFFDSGHYLVKAQTAVADSGKEFLNILTVLSFSYFKQKLIHLLFRQTYVIASEFSFDLVSALFYIFFAFFLFEPTLYFASG